MSKDNPHYIVSRDGSPDLAFDGDMLGSVEGMDTDEQATYTYELYKTEKGKYVCYSKYNYDVVRRTVKICDTTSEIFKFFGQGGLAHELYDNAKIDNYVFID